MRSFSKKCHCLINWNNFLNIFVQKNSFWYQGTHLFWKKSSRGLLKTHLKLRWRIKQHHPFPSPLSQAGAQEGRVRGPPVPLPCGTPGTRGAGHHAWELHATSAFVHVCIKHRLGLHEINACLQMARKMLKCH